MILMSFSEGEDISACCQLVIFNCKSYMFMFLFFFKIEYVVDWLKPIEYYWD